MQEFNFTNLGSIDHLCIYLLNLQTFAIVLQPLMDYVIHPEILDNLFRSFCVLILVAASSKMYLSWTTKALIFWQLWIS